MLLETVNFTLRDALYKILTNPLILVIAILIFGGFILFSLSPYPEKLKRYLVNLIPNTYAYKRYNLLQLQTNKERLIGKLTEITTSTLAFVAFIVSIVIHSFILFFLSLLIHGIIFISYYFKRENTCEQRRDKLIVQALVNKLNENKIALQTESNNYLTGLLLFKFQELKKTYYLGNSFDYIKKAIDIAKAQS